MKEMPDLLFVTGFPRSGTTWTNAIFLQCFDCGFANEVQFILQYHKKLARYGDLGQAANMSRLVTDLLADEYFRILKKSYKIELQQDEVFAGMRAQSYPELVRSILRLVAAKLGKGIVGGKCPSLGWDLNTVAALFPDAKIIHVIRDGRDCALSHYGMAWGFRNAYVAARHWSRYVRGAHAAGLALGPERYLEFRYEELLREPARVTLELQRFLFGAERIDVTERVLAKTGANALAGNYDKWKTAMPARDQGIYEAVAGRELADCGYALTGNEVRLTGIEKMYWVMEDKVRREARHLARRVQPGSSERSPGKRQP